MRLAFSTLACPDWSLDRVLDAAVAYGYGGIELRVLDGELVSPSLPGPSRRALRRMLEAAGIELCCVDTSVQIASPELDMDEALACVDLAADLGGPMIRLFPGDPGGAPLSAAIGRTVERLATLADRGRASGVSIAVETHDSFATGSAMAALLAEAPGDVGVIWDTLNTFVAGEAAETTFGHVSDRLSHVHVKDGGVPPDPERNVLFGDGAVPLDRIVGWLASGGYDGWLSVEWERMWQPDLQDADVALPRYAESLRSALGGVAG